MVTFSQIYANKSVFYKCKRILLPGVSDNYFGKVCQKNSLLEPTHSQIVLFNKVSLHICCSIFTD